jgi:PAS domain-containing protein
MPDGSKRYILNLTAPIFDAKGDIIAVMEMGTDVTEIRHLEDELIESEKKYRLFFNNDPNSIFVFDRKTMKSWTPTIGPPANSAI